MTEQEFLEIVSLHVETWFKPVKKERFGYEEDKCGGLKKRAGKEIAEINLDDCILIKWMSGGVGGGNCWNGDADHYPLAGDTEPELIDLDILLEQVCPNLTHLEYRKLLYGVTPELIEYGEWEQNEYYGNYTIYGYKKVILRRLWERLNGLGVV